MLRACGFVECGILPINDYHVGMFIPSAEIVNLGMVYHMVILLAVWFNRQIYGNVIGVSMQHM
jgi:hypothetical protein